MSTQEILRNRSLGANRGKKLYSSEHFVKNLDITHELEAHLGCVNALNWSSTGQYLASGSDDTNVVIWDSTSSAFSPVKTIQTGHTRNIFGVKFVPDTSDRTLITVAGDRQVRVFDVEYGGGSPLVMIQPCARSVYRAHKDRVKRIAIENDGHCFLTCAEDGEVRQFDLREDHTTAGFRPPLVSYARQQIDLNTITLNKSNPYLFAIGGSHPCAFLHDRRMVGRDFRSEWGSVPTSGAATHCVRKFRSSKKRRNAYRGEHITALHFGNENPRELLGSWSADNVYLFDIYADTDVRTKSSTLSTAGKRASMKEQYTNLKKRKKSSINNLEAKLRLDEVEGFERFLALRQFLLGDPVVQRDYEAAKAHLDQVVRSSSDMSSPAFQGTSRTRFFSLMKVHTRFLDLLAHTEGLSSLEFEEHFDWCTTFIIRVLNFYASSGMVPRIHSSRDFSISDTDDEEIMNRPVTMFGNDTHILFDSHRIMASAFDSLIGSQAQTVQALSETGRRFWLEKVCRSLLAAPEIDAFTLYLTNLALQARHDELLTLDEQSDLDRVRMSTVAAADRSEHNERDDDLSGEGNVADDINDNEDSDDDDDDDDNDDDDTQEFLDEEEMSEENPEVRQTYATEAIDDPQESEYVIGLVESNTELENDTDSDTEISLDESLIYMADSDDEEDSNASDQAEGSGETYEQDINSAAEQVSPGVPIVLPIRSYTGHINVETVKDVNFFGQSDEFVVSGSDDGLLFVWRKKDAGIVTMLQGDSSVTNVMEGHPYSTMLAASGIDNTVKIFEPMEFAAENSRRIAESEYQIRARNERRASGEERQNGGSIRISRSMLMNLASQMDETGQTAESCRMQ